MRFTFRNLDIPGVIEIEHEHAQDARGFFSETFRAREFEDAGIPGPFVQENHSRSALGVLRGLHYQIRPKAQAKLVRCLRGAIFDVAVDLRRDSPHYGRWVARELNDSNRRMLYIPVGFAHGFYVLSDWADVLYGVTEYYSQECDRGIRWDDPDISIAWPQGPRHVSPKDASLPLYREAQPDF